MTAEPAKVAPYCQAPDPNPRTPRLETPPGTTDTHFHILGPASAYPFVPDREYTPPDALPVAYNRVRNILGIERVVLVQPSVYGTNNACMLNAAALLNSPARFVVVVPFSVSDKELQRLHDAGARAIRFIVAHSHGLPLADLKRFSARVRDMGWHVQVLLRPADLVELEAALAALPTDFVIDHIGLIRPADGGIAQPAFQALLRLYRTAHCWIKLTGGYRISSEPPPYRDVVPLVSALCDERSDRLLWGTDWPHVLVKGEMPNTTELLDVLLEWIPDEEIRRRILSENPETLFGFSHRG